MDVLEVHDFSQVKLQRIPMGAFHHQTQFDQVQFDQPGLVPIGLMAILIGVVKTDPAGEWLIGEGRPIWMILYRPSRL